MIDINIEPITLEIIQKALFASAGNPIFIVLFVVIVGDIITGYAKNYLYHTGNSSAGIQGLIKHSTVLIIALFAGFCGAILQSKHTLLGADVIIGLFAVEYIKSIFENFGVMGFKYPKMLSAKVEKEIEEKMSAKEEAEKLKRNRNL